jgi:hypothetical protein
MKDFNQQQREWERRQEDRPGGPGYDDNPDRDDDWEEDGELQTGIFAYGGSVQCD